MKPAQYKVYFIVYPFSCHNTDTVMLCLLGKTGNHRPRCKDYIEIQLFQYCFPGEANTKRLFFNAQCLYQDLSQDILPELFGVPLGSTFWNSLGLSLYFTMYPDSSRNSDTVQGDRFSGHLGWESPRWSVHDTRKLYQSSLETLFRNSLIIISLSPPSLLSPNLLFAPNLPHLLSFSSSSSFLSTLIYPFGGQTDQIISNVFMHSYHAAIHDHQFEVHCTVQISGNIFHRTFRCTNISSFDDCHWEVHFLN